MASEISKNKKKNRELLNEAGLRNTSQRQSILDIIRRGQGHLDADEVYRRARKKQPRLSLSTVYRTLQTLKELGLVEEVHLDETHHHYEIKASSEHHHLICLGCGKVVEFECPMSTQMKEEVSRDKGFEVVDTEVRMTGYCPDCRKERELSDVGK
ncbi:MAG: transcriptional repressor [Dehalococcoidales bacterium]|nr:MAG: transcriptional repressor [Dehalococcoidales bacterium]